MQVIIRRGALRMPQRSAAQPNCFRLCSDCHAYTEGDWVARASAPPYSAKTAMLRKGVGESKYFTCDQTGPCNITGPIQRADTAIGASRLPKQCPVARLGHEPEDRGHFDWLPRNCALHPASPASSCAMLEGKQIVLVGDSSMEQFFLALVLLLDGQIAKDRSSRMMTQASVCNDNSRVVFVRNDLLSLMPDSTGLKTSMRQCYRDLSLGQFAQLAVDDADLLVLTSGLHVPRALHLFNEHGNSNFSQHVRDMFFTHNLQHTLGQIVERRRAMGHLPGSAVLLGTPLAVPGCARYASPISLATALRADPSLSVWSGYWLQLRGMNAAARWTCSSLGMPFLDVGPLSLQRPDATLARYRNADDCMHTCQPGPVDVWVQLWLNLVSTQHQAHQERLGAHLQPQPQPQLRPRRFFQNDRSTWLTGRGDLQLRKTSSVKIVCSSGSTRWMCSAICEPWWPFHANSCSALRKLGKQVHKKLHDLRNLCRSDEGGTRRFRT